MSTASIATKREALVAPALGFLRCRTPPSWVEAAVADLETLLVDHASLELRAAEQAQKLIRRYGASGGPGSLPDEDLRLKLLQKMSRLAREELRHFEQVVELLAQRGVAYEPLTASRYARSLHEQVRSSEPGRCIDTLIVGAVIEARSCERFFRLLARLEATEPELAGFYASLLRSESRHFEDYLALAQGVAGTNPIERIDRFLELDAELVTAPDTETRFHSGPPTQ
ncbi:MAG: tRNA-(ms[2]io[6]A)-hydroxylase [Gammaproteobacteria bacterium]|nr:tRNA-(ms[2]io[6]A)-hydroxylase [Gammaproteobacteria bacterium]